MKKNTYLHKIFHIFLVAGFLLGNVATVRAYSPFDPYEEMQILKGDIAVVPAKAITRVAISDPLIADVQDAKANEVLVVGNAVGQSTLFIWDASGKRTVLIRVVEEDISIVRVRIEKLLLSAGITSVLASENPYEGKVILTGILPEEKKDTFQQIITPFEEKIINFVGKEAVVEDLVQIDMQVTELSTTLSKELGVDWATGGTPGLGPQWDETVIPGDTGKFRDLVRIGDFSRTTALTARINALITEGKGKILSKPRLVVVNGKEATFLVGGEIPIRTTNTTSGGSVQQNVEFKEYGVTLAITPTIRQGKVDIVLNVELSDVDATHSTATDVAFTTRSAQTQLLLDDRQTIVLAGLIKKRDNTQVSRIPLLGAIPILGALFRSKRTPLANEDTEVVISLTPTIVKTSQAVEGVFKAQGVSGRLQETAPSAIPQAIAGYAKTVQDKISSTASFPLEAIKNGWQGVVKLEVVITREGALKDVYIKQSSGYDVFDQNALNTAQAVAPFGAFPGDIQREELSLTIPIMYSADVFARNPPQGK
jgi:pilus assembly protein CpaC